MNEEQDQVVPVTFADGVRDDIANLVGVSAYDDDRRASEVLALKRRVAELLVECKANPFVGVSSWVLVAIPSWQIAAGFGLTFPRIGVSRGFG